MEDGARIIKIINFYKTARSPLAGFIFFCEMCGALNGGVGCWSRCLTGSNLKLLKTFTEILKIFKNFFFNLVEVFKNLCHVKLTFVIFTIPLFQFSPTVVRRWVGH